MPEPNDAPLLAGQSASAPKIKGIFSSSEDIGHQTQYKQHWFAKEISPDTISLQPLDQDHLPAGPQVIKTRSDFLNGYLLEPELCYKLLTQRVMQGDFYRKQGLNQQAKDEYQNVLRIDEENIRANFGLGLTYLALNQLDKGKYVFECLVRLDESFKEEHKHLFNDFGIGLRKKMLYDEAIAFYARAAELSPGDEHIHVNMARALYEKNDVERAVEGLKKALEINPSLNEALIFLDFLKRRGYRPQSEEPQTFFPDA
ncbi:MAG: tetratricopeptide repeat protein [Desulfovibrionaceae bacterium]|nr:tetratricopeptide repeat protein [Desulfovibrionaceae bacterium]MBF0513048.1 tetratricopeptide repeat protein [Desulfovibrionaceae bacterium]